MEEEEVKKKEVKLSLTAARQRPLVEHHPLVGPLTSVRDWPGRRNDIDWSTNLRTSRSV